MPSLHVNCSTPILTSKRMWNKSYEAKVWMVHKETSSNIYTWVGNSLLEKKTLVYLGEYMQYNVWNLGHYIFSKLWYMGIAKCLTLRNLLTHHKANAMLSHVSCHFIKSFINWDYKSLRLWPLSLYHFGVHAKSNNSQCACAFILSLPMNSCASL